jgi:hypothetical protein
MIALCGSIPPFVPAEAGTQFFATKPGSPHPRGRTEFDEPIQYELIAV